MGRPSTFTQDIADEICERILEGESLRHVCAENAMPNRSTVLRWLDENEDFAAKYARARELQGDYMDDLILEAAAETDSENAPAQRVRIDAYKWRASKLKPKRYGDKTLVGSDPDNPLPVGFQVAVREARCSSFRGLAP
jgi:hypothetical protein